MADVFYPDRSQFQGHTPVSSLLVMARATEGDWLTDPDYAWNVADAKNRGVHQAAYHFLESRSPAAAQASHCHSVVGSAPLMLDLEPIMGGGALAAAGGGPGHYCGQAWHDLVHARAGTAMAAGDPETADLERMTAAAVFVSKPALATAISFITAYRHLGGVCHDLYFPHWYWQALGSPDLRPLASMGVWLTSSQYQAYTKTGGGWAGYGGLVPTCWQYTDNGPGGMDWNAYQGQDKTIGGSVAELWSLLTTGSRTTARKALKVWTTGAGKSLHQLAADHPGNGAAGILGNTYKHLGDDWGDLRAYVNAGDWDAPLPAGTRVWLWQS